jgi:hypothetical protein
MLNRIRHHPGMTLSKNVNFEGESIEKKLEI